MGGFDEPHDQVVHKVDDITLDLETLQVSLHTLVQKVKAIKVDVCNIDASGSYRKPSEDLEEEVEWLSQKQALNRLFTPVEIPTALDGRWAQIVPGTAEEIIMNTRRSSRVSERAGSKRLKRLRWDSRWQDLFDSNEQEAKDDDADPARGSNRRKSGKVVWWRTSGKYKEDEPSACILHPHSIVRVVWDMIGLLMIIFDTISIPIYTAWDLGLDLVGTILLAIGTVYWCLDIGLSFNTGFFKEAKLVLSRQAVALHYFRTWFGADVFLVSLDLAMLFSPGISGSGGQMFRSIRAVRIVRLARGLRLFKLSKVSLAIEYYMNVYGGNPAVLIIAVIKTLGCIYLLAHLACCTWFFIGRETRHPNASWHDLVNFDDATFLDQYIRSCYWVLGHLTAAPVDPTIFPQNPVERLFTLLCIVSSLLVIGIAISKMSNTVAVLNRANAEANDTKRTLQAYLHLHRFPAEISVRIVRHALEVHKKRAAMTLDPFVLGLLSKSLVSDINAWQRSTYLNQHPLFALVSDLHPEVSHGIYSSFTGVIYADTDTVYKVGTLSEILYITTGGRYMLHYFPDLSDNAVVTEYDTTQFFCEVSLFVQVRHRSTLKALTFSDSLCIHGTEFLDCVRLFPSCISTLYKYAREYLSYVVELQPMSPDVEPIQLSWEIALHDVMPNELAQKASTVARGTKLPQLAEVVTPCVEAKIVHDAMTSILEEDLSTQEIVDQLGLAFPEVREETGLYSQMSEDPERKRSIGAMLGIIWLTKNEYESFIESQKMSNRMSYELWSEWQRFLQWTAPSKEILHALFVLLGIRGLGKTKTLTKIVPSGWRSPENTVLYLAQFAPTAVPSVTHLSEEQFNLVIRVLETHKEFNLAQLMQGENTPYHILALKDCIESDVEGEVLVKFYLLCLVGMMCGLTGAVTWKGCLFMDENNGVNVLVCIECLRQLNAAEPHTVYWSYISKRGRWLGLALNTAVELTIARLACLTRSSLDDCKALQETWAMLDPYDRSVLAEHFLADGIHERTFLLSFLPVYLLNAKTNRVVGLYRGLIVLIDLILTLKTNGVVNNINATMIEVNISDVANFTKDVINPLAFESLAEYAKIATANGEIRVTVGPKLWQASTNDEWRPDPVSEIAHEVRRMSRVARSVLAKNSEAEPMPQIAEDSIHKRIVSTSLPSLPRVTVKKSRH